LVQLQKLHPGRHRQKKRGVDVFQLLMPSGPSVER